MLLNLALAAILSLSIHVGQAPLSVKVDVHPPSNGWVCIHIWDKNVVGGENAPVHQSCWSQDKKDPPMESRTYQLSTGDFIVRVSVDGNIVGSSETLIVSEENPSNKPCRNSQCPP